MYPEARYHYCKTGNGTQTQTKDGSYKSQPQVKLPSLQFSLQGENFLQPMDLTHRVYLEQALGRTVGVVQQAYENIVGVL